MLIKKQTNALESCELFEEWNHYIISKEKSQAQLSNVHILYDKLFVWLNVEYLSHASMPLFVKTDGRVSACFTQKCP